MTKRDCSGTILDKNTILTTADCVKSAIPNSPNYLVFAGVVDKLDQSAQSVLVKETFIHPDFDPNMIFGGNIAILKLKTPLNFVDGIVQPACLPDSFSNPIKGEIVVTSGWGFTENDVAPNKLLVIHNSAHYPQEIITNCQKSCQTKVFYL